MKIYKFRKSKREKDDLPVENMHILSLCGNILHRAWARAMIVGEPKHTNSDLTRSSIDPLNIVLRPKSLLLSLFF